MEQPDSVNGTGEDVEEIELDVVSTPTPSATPIPTPISVDNVTSPTPIDVDSISHPTLDTADSVDQITPIDFGRTNNPTPIDVDSINNPSPIDVDNVNSSTPSDGNSVNNPTPIDVDSIRTPMPIDVDSVDNHNHVVDTQTSARIAETVTINQNKATIGDKGDSPDLGNGFPTDLVSSTSPPEPLLLDKPLVCVPDTSSTSQPVPGIAVLTSQPVSSNAAPTSQPVSSSAVSIQPLSNQDEINQSSPRQRSGSVGEAADAPRCGSGGNEINGHTLDRPRSGSMGQIESQTSQTVPRPRKTTTNFRIVDIVQLQRPRNPGGILPLENDTNQEALDLIVNEKRGKNRTVSEKESLSWTRPRNLDLPGPNFNTISSQNRRHSDVGSYSRVAATTSGPSVWLSSINETVERPQPSSVVDNEGMAKKIARLDSSLISTSREEMWLGRGGLVPMVRMTAARTPPERPKVPRRQFSPLVPNSRTRPSPGRQRMSPAQEISPSSETSRLSVGSGIQSAIDVERMSPDSHQTQGYSLYSPDDMVPVTSSRNHKCRYCNYATTSYTQLQFHLAKHGGSHKALKCSLCDYMTNEKSNFRRHRRLHSRGNQASIIKCGKCSYATTLPYKIREHYLQIHNDVRGNGISQDVPLVENGIYSAPHRLINSRCTLGSLSINHNPGDSLAGQVPYLGYTPLMMNGHSNTYPYATNNRQPSLNSLDPFINSQYGILRSRPEGQQAVSNYLRSILPSAVNSHSTPRHPTSTLTSSDYFISPVVDPAQHVETLRNHRDIDISSVSNTVQSSPDVKVKVEPIEIDAHSDVSSTANGYTTPDLSQTAEVQPLQQIHSLNEIVSTTHSNHGNVMSRTVISPHRRNNQSERLDDRCLNRGQAVVRSLNLETVLETRENPRTRPTGLQRSRSCTDLVGGSDVYNSFNSSISSTLRFGTKTVGVQCVLPVIKTEIDLNGDYFHHHHHQPIIGQHFSIKGVERGVQCSIISANRSNQQQGPEGDSGISGDRSDLSEHRVVSESRCDHCGIVFEDEVMFSIHIGCHSHTDPFICNICGKRCGNKYGFYSHIMRGHHF